MTTTTTTTARAATLQVPRARLHYEVRGAGPLLALVGAPMDAVAFAPLAELVATDHTVLTTDPRGIHRSRVEDPEADSTPELRAEDLYRLITHVDAGPATVFGSSGGAVTALALVQTHPEQVHTVIAHEPPLDELLPDREQSRARTEDCCATYLAGDVVGAWTMFFDQANIAIPAEVAEANLRRGTRHPRRHRRALLVRPRTAPLDLVAARPGRAPLRVVADRRRRAREAGTKIGSTRPASA